MAMQLHGPPWILECVILWGVPTFTGRACFVCGGSPVLQPDPNQRFVRQSHDPEYCIQCWVTWWAERHPDCQAALYNPVVDPNASSLVEDMVTMFRQVPCHDWPTVLRTCASLMERRRQAFQNKDAEMNPTNPAETMASQSSCSRRAGPGGAAPSATSKDMPPCNSALWLGASKVHQVMVETRWKQLRRLLRLRDAAADESTFPLRPFCPEHSSGHVGHCNRCHIYRHVMDDLEERHPRPSRERTLRLRQELEAGVIMLESFGDLNHTNNVHLLWNLARALGPLGMADAVIKALHSYSITRAWQTPADLRAFV